MYKIYRWKVKLKSSFITPFQSDTIYGHMFWAIQFLYGESEIEKTVAEFRAYKPPFICSNGFINDYIPYLEPFNIEEEELLKLDKKEYVKRVTEAKRLKKIKSFELDVFNEMREKGKNEVLKTRDIKLLDNKFVEESVMHNTIDRLSGTTLENGLYNLDEKFIDGTVSIYIKLREDYPFEKLEEILRYIERTGFGKRASVGKGQLERVELAEFKGFSDIQGDGYVVLSNYIPKQYDYSEVIYGELLTKRGKVGESSERAEFPYKKPFACYTAGSIFRKGENAVIGKVLENIHIDSKVIQVGIPFTLEVKIS